MLFKDMPIRRKLMRVIILIIGVVLLVTCLTFFIYELYSFRKTTRQNLSTLGKIVAANSTAALAFDNQVDAKEILAALKAEPHIMASALYDRGGHLFAHCTAGPGTMPFPPPPLTPCYQLTPTRLPPAR